MQLLLVDDNPVNISVAALMLERLGYQADVATDGRQAVEAAIARPYAAVLMDCEMPVLNGYEATAEIRRRLADLRLPIIAMTANATADDRSRCMEAGMDDFLPKPIMLPALEAMLQQWVGEPPAAAD